jgi:hypothetical protein
MSEAGFADDDMEWSWAVASPTASKQTSSRHVRFIEWFLPFEYGVTALPGLQEIVLKPTPVRFTAQPG